MNDNSVFINNPISSGAIAGLVSAAAIELVAFRTGHVIYAPLINIELAVLMPLTAKTTFRMLGANDIWVSLRKPIIGFAWGAAACGILQVLSFNHALRERVNGFEHSILHAVNLEIAGRNDAAMPVLTVCVAHGIDPVALTKA